MQPTKYAESTPKYRTHPPSSIRLFRNTSPGILTAFRRRSSNFSALLWLLSWPSELSRVQLQQVCTENLKSESLNNCFLSTLFEKKEGTTNQCVGYVEEAQDCCDGGITVPSEEKPTQPCSCPTGAGIPLHSNTRPF